MRVFITGGTGYVGSAIVRALVGAGHDVTGLVRSEESAGRLGSLGGTPHRGELGDGDSYRDAAGEAEALVHVGFDYSAPVETDRTAVETLLGTAAAGSGPRGVVYTSGCWIVGETGEEPADEGVERDPAGVVAWRPEHEDLVLDAGSRELATAVIRPGMVYGGEGGLVTRFFESAGEEGAAAHVGSGENHWSFVHRDDLARLYLRIVEEGAGGVFHGVDGAPAPVAEAARAASEAAGAGGETRSIPLAEAREEMGPMADALIMDQRLVGPRARELGWAPGRSSFLDAVDEAYLEWKG